MSFKRLDQEDISISAEAITAPLWSTGISTLTTFATSSNQTAGPTGDYYYKVFSDNNTFLNSEFSITFGDKNGGGALQYNTNVQGKSPSSTIYGQFRNLVFGDEDTDFIFGTVAQNTIYAITFDRARYKEKLLPGSFNITLQDTSGNQIKLTDNSRDTTTISYVDAGRVYEIVSGSNGNAYSGSGYTDTDGSYGKFLPDVGVVIFNAAALDLPFVDGGVNLGTIITPATEGFNMDKLYSAIYRGAECDALSEETISSNYVFVRVRNSEFNYTTNPSNITGSGELRYSIMVNTPQAYITTVGLYNDSNDLLAVAKLSKPLLKDFTKEALVRIKLDY